MTVDVSNAFEAMQDMMRFTQFYQTQKKLALRYKSPSTVCDEITPENSMLFTASKTPIRRQLLSKCLPWLETQPLLRLGSTLGDGCMHVMPHPDWVRGCCFSLDGQLVASSSDDSRVRLWDVETGELQHVIKGFNDLVYGVVMSSTGPDRCAILAAFTAGVIRLWEPSTGKYIATLSNSTINARAVKPGFSMETTNDGKRFPRRHENAYIEDVSITPAGDKLAAAIGNNVTVWELPDFHNPTEWSDNRGVDRLVRCVRFSSTGDPLASASGNDITVWDTKNGQPWRRFLGVETHPIREQGDEDTQDAMIGHEKNIHGLAFAPNSQFLASGSDDTTARIWDIGSGTTSVVLKYHNRAITAVAFSFDSTRLAVASYDWTISIWRQLQPGTWGNGEVWTQPSHVMSGHTNQIRSISFAPGRNLLASASIDKSLRIWDTGIMERSASQGFENQLRQTGATNIRGTSHQYPVIRLALSLDGRKIASASSDGMICLWNGETGDQECTTQEHQVDVTSLMFSRKTTYLVSASIDHTAIVWDVDSSRGKITPKYRLKGHSDWVRDVTMSANECLVATASDDRTVRVWDIASTSANSESDGVPFRVFNGHTDYVYTVAFSGDSARLASAGDDFHVMIWSLVGEDGKQKVKEVPEHDMSDPLIAYRLRGVPSRIRGVAFLADDSKVVSVSMDGAVAIWCLDPGKGLRCHITLRVDSAFNVDSSIRISIDEKYPNVLLTEFGAWECSFDAPISQRALSATVQELHPDWSPLGINKRGTWITWKNRNLIYLPAEFRPANEGSLSCWVQNDTVVIGCYSGKVLLFRVKNAWESRYGMVVPRS